MLNCIESFNMSFRVRVYKMLPENIAIRCFDVRKSPRINKYILKKKMPISLERKHDYDLDFFFSFYWISSSSKQSVLMLIMPQYLFFQCYIEFSPKPSPSPWKMDISIFREGGGSTKGEKLLYNIGRLVYKKSFCVTLDQWIKEVLLSNAFATDLT